jgi:hypothetical protein
LDLRGSDDVLRGAVAGCGDDVHNAFALVYDVWRLFSTLLLEVLRPHLGAIESDVMALARRAARAPSDGGLPARADAELHWKPYLLDGPLAEELLADPAFDRFRCGLDTAADAIFWEVPPSPEAEARYLAVTTVRRRAGDALVPRAVAHAAFPPARRSVPAGALESLRTFARNYEGTALGRATLYHKHSPAARARFLFMELTLLHAVLDHVFSEVCAVEARARAGSEPLMCALADAVSVVLHASWTWVARPASMEDYHGLVREALELPCVSAAARAPIRRPPVSVAEGDALLDVRVDADIARFKGVFSVRKKEKGIP